jgi:3-hydroxybutyryl-CoA dehydrogenase
MTVPGHSAPTTQTEGDALMSEAVDSSSLTAVIGAGRMGLGIAESFVMAGLGVVFAEVTPERAHSSPARLAERMRGHAAAGLIDDAALGRAAQVRAADDIPEAVAGADLIIECVTEDIGVKEVVLRACDAAARPDAILASNTSSLNIATLSGFVGRPERFLGMHWFNPPEWTPGVEVVLGPHTDRAVVDRVVDLLRGIGKQPSVVAGGVGFIANRLQMAMFCEAARCVEEGLASPRDIDEVVRSCFGFRLPFFGPFQIADMAGLDVYEAVVEQHEQGFGDRFRVPDTLRRLVREGRCGTAAGGGFYDYEPGASERLLVERDTLYASLSGLLERRPPPSFDGGEPGP